MNAAVQTPAERMSPTDIQAELEQLEEASRMDYLTHGRRDFKTEAEQAAAQEADEIRAEATLYAGRQRKRSARCNELETALTALKAADVSQKIEGIAKAHGEALEEAHAALSEIDFDALTALEEQISHYLLAEGSVRKHAAAAVYTAKNAGVAAPDIQSIYSTQLSLTHDRLERLKRQISSSSQRVAHDQARLGVNYTGI